jgi:serine-type D-Ala-D-Ala carboxypeptidase (penicillin-binding protein 5/6)
MRRLLVMIAALLAGALPAHAASPPPVDLASYVIADGRDGRVLAQRNADAPRAIASITKMMTAYLALRDDALTKTYTVPVAATRIGESTAGLRAGHRVTGRDLLEGLLVPSANDAAETLAIGIAGSESAFVDRMNQTARRLGMRDTVYRAPYGLDTAGQHSTAADQLILARLLMRDGRVRSIAKLRSAVVDGVRLAASNTLLGNYAGLDGVKTGHTGQAGWCLAASAKRGARRIFVVGLGAPNEASRNQEIARLLDWGFAQLHPVTAVRAGAPAGTVPLPYGGTVGAEVARSLRVTLRPGERLRLRYRVASVHLPLAQGDPVGQVDVMVGSKVVASAPLAATRAVADPGLFDRLSWFAGHLFDPFGF